MPSSTRYGIIRLQPSPAQPCSSRRGGAEGKGLYHHVLCGYDADHTFFLFLYAGKAAAAIITFIIAYAASRVVLKVADKLFARSRMEKTIEKFLRSALRILMWALIFLIVAARWALM